MQHNVIVSKIENIEQNLKMLDNIFKCFSTYWNGESAMAVQDLYKGLSEDIENTKKYLELIMKKIGTQEIKKLPGDIF